MNTWHEIMYAIAINNPDVKFSFVMTGPQLSIDVEFHDGSRGSIYQTSGGNWTFGG